MHALFMAKYQNLIYGEFINEAFVQSSLIEMLYWVTSGVT